MDFSIRDAERFGETTGAFHWKRITAGEWLLFTGMWIVSLIAYLATAGTTLGIVTGFGWFFFTLPFVFIGIHSLRYSKNTADNVGKSSTGGETAVTSEGTTSTDEQGTQASGDSRNQPTEKIRNRARKSVGAAVFMGIFISPAAYVYVGKWGWAVASFLTVNFFLLGFVIVPIHTYFSIKNARQEVGYSQ